MYADGELPDGESRLIRDHLQECGTCRRLVGEMETERQALIHSFRDTDFLEFELDDSSEAAHAEATYANKAGLLRLATAILAIAALLRPAPDVLGNLELPDSLDWLNPFSTAGQATLLINTAAYVVPEVIAGLDS